MSETKPKRKIGRPTLYSKSLALRICKLVSTSALNLAEICEMAGTSFQRFSEWQHAHPEFADMVSRAMVSHYKLVGAHLPVLADENPIQGDKSDNARVRWLDVRIKTRQWWLSKHLPSIYGDKLDISADVTFTVPQLVGPGAQMAALKPGAPQDVVVESVQKSLKAVND